MQLQTVVFNRWSASLVGPSRTLIYYIGHNKNCIFLSLVSFWPNIDAVNQQRQQKVDRDESVFYNPLKASCSAVLECADGAVTLQ